jgi:hypothetical protein
VLTQLTLELTAADGFGAGITWTANQHNTGS